MDTQTLKPFSVPRTAEQRFVSIGFVVLIHAALFWALWKMGVMDSILPPAPPPITVSLPRTEFPPPPTPIEPTDRVRIEMITPVIPEPPIDYVETITPPPGGTVTGDRGNAGIVVEGPRSIARTITRPPYPPISRRLGEQGVVTLRMMISDSGVVTDATVVRSSGFARLDAAAVEWVVAHWRYKPAMRDGTPVTSVADARVTFELK